jgi:hypothetical protein
MATLVQVKDIYMFMGKENIFITFETKKDEE